MKFRDFANLLDPGSSPLAPKFMRDAYKQTIGGKLQRATNEYIDPYYDPKVRAQYLAKGGKVKKFSKGGSMDDNEVRSNLPAVSNTRKGPSKRLGPAKVRSENRAKVGNDDLTPRSNLPKEQFKFAKGGSVRGCGCATKGKGFKAG